MDNVYEAFNADKHLFNFSGYKKESPFYDDGNKGSEKEEKEESSQKKR